MTNHVIVSSVFKGEAKRLAKKYGTLQETINKLIGELERNPFIGQSYGGGLYKIRIADQSKGKEKRAGFRVLYFNIIKKEHSTLFVLMSIYDKSEKDTIIKQDGIKLIKDILKEDDIED